jgi:hypothetical protein
MTVAWADEPARHETQSVRYRDRRLRGYKWGYGIIASERLVDLHPLLRFVAPFEFRDGRPKVSKLLDGIPALF